MHKVLTCLIPFPDQEQWPKGPRIYGFWPNMYDSTPSATIYCHQWLDSWNALTSGGLWNYLEFITIRPGFSNEGSRPTNESLGNFLRVAAKLSRRGPSRAMLKNNVWSITVRILHVQQGYCKNCTILMTFRFFIFMISVKCRHINLIFATPKIRPFFLIVEALVKCRIQGCRARTIMVDSRVVAGQRIKRRNWQKTGRQWATIAPRVARDTDDASRISAGKQKMDLSPTALQQLPPWRRYCSKPLHKQTQID